MPSALQPNNVYTYAQLQAAYASTFPGDADALRNGTVTLHDPGLVTMPVSDLQTYVQNLPGFTIDSANTSVKVTGTASSIIAAGAGVVDLTGVTAFSITGSTIVSVNQLLSLYNENPTWSRTGNLTVQGPVSQLLLGYPNGIYTPALQSGLANAISISGANTGISTAQIAQLATLAGASNATLASGATLTVAGTAQNLANIAGVVTPIEQHLLAIAGTVTISDTGASLSIADAVKLANIPGITLGSIANVPNTIIIADDFAGATSDQLTSLAHLANQYAATSQVIFAATHMGAIANPISAATALAAGMADSTRSVLYQLAHGVNPVGFEVTGATVANVAQLNALSVYPLWTDIADTAAAVVSDINLGNASTILASHLNLNPSIAMTGETIAGLTTDAAALNALNTANIGWTTTVTDTFAHVATDLGYGNNGKLAQYGANSHIESVAMTGTTIANLVGWTGFPLADHIGSFTFAVADSSAHISSDLNGMSYLSAYTNDISGISFTDPNPALTLSAPTLNNIIGGNHALALDLAAASSVSR